MPTVFNACFGFCLRGSLPAGLVVVVGAVLAVLAGSGCADDTGGTTDSAVQTPPVLVQDTSLLSGTNGTLTRQQCVFDPAHDSLGVEVFEIGYLSDAIEVYGFVVRACDSISPPA